MPLLLLRASLLVYHWPSIMRGPYCAALLIVQALGVCICAPRCCTVIWGVRQFLGLSCRLHSCLLPPYSAVCVRASTSGLLPATLGDIVCRLCACSWLLQVCVCVFLALFVLVPCMGEAPSVVLSLYLQPCLSVTLWFAWFRFLLPAIFRVPSVFLIPRLVSPRSVWYFGWMVSTW